jgi:diadenosine tetraphosphate (Ap4A) HIT family hydrolase
MDYDQLKIKSYVKWDLYLHENQCYLGRVFLQLRDEQKVMDFLDIAHEVREEFFFAGQQIKTALNTLFKPDKMNYAALSNVSPKIHVHFIPRYQEERVFNNITFKDERWGKNYAPYNRAFELDHVTLLKIRDALQHVLNDENRD